MTPLAPLPNRDMDQENELDSTLPIRYSTSNHAAAEEETSYAKLISKTWGQDVAFHSMHEHQFDQIVDRAADKTGLCQTSSSLVSHGPPVGT